MTEPHELARALARKIAGVTDAAMRVRYVSHTLEGMPAERIADVVTIAMTGAEARDGELGALLLTICLALAEEEREPLRAEVVQAAFERGQNDTAALLQPRPPLKESDQPIDVPDFGVGRPVSLGERKSLARKRDRDLLARVLRDPSPEVIRILLGNPALTEDDVLRLCATRPIAPEVLRVVFRSTRWIVRYRVRRAIVKNPFAPIDVALQLAVLLNAQDAREVASSTDLAPTLCDACRRVAGLGTIH